MLVKNGKLILTVFSSIFGIPRVVGTKNISYTVKKSVEEHT